MHATNAGWFDPYLVSTGDAIGTTLYFPKRATRSLGERTFFIHVMSTDLLSFEHPSVLLFCFSSYATCDAYCVWALTVIEVLCCLLEQREKGRGPIQSYDKSPYTHRQIKNATWQHKKNRLQHFDYTIIADQHRTVSWGNDSHPTGVFKSVNGIPTLPLTTTVV